MLAGAIAGGVQMGIAAAAGGIHRDAAVGGSSARPAWTASDTSGVRPMATTTMSAATVAASAGDEKARLVPDGGVRVRLAVAAGNARAQAQVHAGVADAFGQPVRQGLGQHAFQQARRAFQDADFSAQRARGGRHFQAQEAAADDGDACLGARPAQRGGVVQRADVMHAGRAARQAGQFARPPAGRQQAAAGDRGVGQSGNAAAGVDAHDLGARQQRDALAFVEVLGMH